MNELQRLKNNISKNRRSLVCDLIGAEQEVVCAYLNLDNEDSTPFEKSIEKHYSLMEVVYLSGDYKHLLDAELLDYGVDFGNEELEKQLGVREDSPLTLEVSQINYQESEITLRGSIFADLLAASSNNPIAKISVFGICKDAYECLELYQILIYEAYVLERRGESKLSFFTYFSAFESYVSIHLQRYKDKIYPELHHALEHLGLDEKIKVIVKESIPGSDVSGIGVWGELMSTFKKVKLKRNDIAHAKSQVIIDSKDINNVVFCICCLICIANNGLVSFANVRNYYFKKSKNR